MTETSSPPVAALPPPTRARETKRASKRCPPDFAPTPATRTWAEEHFPAVDFAEALAAMRDYEFRSGHTDWDATLRTWIRNEAKKRPGFGGAHRSAEAKAAGLTDKEYNTLRNGYELIQEIQHGTAGQPTLHSGAERHGLDV